MTCEKGLINAIHNLLKLQEFWKSSSKIFWPPWNGGMISWIEELIKIAVVLSYSGVAQNFQKPTSNLKILCTSMVTWTKFQTEYPQILGTTVQNSVVMVIWHTGFVHRCLIPYIVVSDIYKCVIHSNDNDNFLYILDNVCLLHVRNVLCQCSTFQNFVGFVASLKIFLSIKDTSETCIMVIN
jgi:hypothetical protein